MTARVPTSATAEIAAEPLGTWFRNVPDSALTVGAISQAGWRVTDLLLPTLTLRRSALDHNLALFARWCGDNGVSHAPHGKTTMAPQLFDAQLAAGVWAITAATVAQARLMRRHGVPRVLLANEVVDEPGLRWLAAEVSAGFDAYVLADSVAGIERMERTLAEAQATRTVPVLLELGVHSGRGGARSEADALAAAERLTASGHLALAGVECFEGVFPQDRADRSLRRVDGFLADLAGLLAELDQRGLFQDREEIILTAGGSGYPDRVVAAFQRMSPLSRPVRCVVRSGGYVTHDHGLLERCSPLSASARHPLGVLRPALELWGHVLSTPEPGLAICGFGRRDAPYDADLPIPIARLAPDGTRQPAPDARVDKLNDQHAFLSHTSDLAVGDVLVFGVSHPCTAFEKWPLIPVLDDADRVVDAIRTYF